MKKKLICITNWLNDAVLSVQHVPWGTTDHSVVSSVNTLTTGKTVGMASADVKRKFATLQRDVNKQRKVI